jgi:hypothetical protein
MSPLYLFGDVAHIPIIPDADGFQNLSLPMFIVKIDFGVMTFGQCLNSRSGMH